MPILPSSLGGSPSGLLGPLTISISAFQNSSLMSAYERGRILAGNRIGETLAPSPDMILQAYWSGMLGELRADPTRLIRDSALGDHGIQWPQSHQAAETVGQWQDYRSDVWRSYIDLSQPWIDWKVLREAWLREYAVDPNFPLLSSQGAVEQALKRQGIRDPHWLKLLVEMGEQLGVSEILSLYWGRLLVGDQEQEVRRLLRGKGYTDEATIVALLKQSHSLSPAETLILWNRGSFGDPASPVAEDTADKYLAWAGLTNTAARERFKELRREIPGPSDIVRFAVREVFTPSLFLQYGFGDELPPDFRKWIQKQGFTEQFTVTDATTGATVDMDWALAYWGSHWQWPSPDMAYRMLQRFRPTGGADGAVRDPSRLVFTQQNLSDLLKGSDYPPYWRPYLENLNYRVMDVRPIRWGVETEVFTTDEATERYQDQGYHRETALKLSEIDEARREFARGAWKRSFRQSSRKKIVNCLLTQYKVGMMDEPAATQALRSAGLGPNVTERLIRQIDLCELAAQVSQVIGRVRGMFLRGEIDVVVARERLTNSAIVPSRIDGYIRLWQIQLTPYRKRLSASQIITALNAGFVNQFQATTWLTNLGWSNTDIIVLLALGQAQAAKAFAAAAESQSRKVKAANRELTAGIRQAKQTQESLLSELRRNEPLGTLKSLAKKGKITRTEFEERLTARGIPASSIGYYLSEVYG